MINRLIDYMDKNYNYIFLNEIIEENYLIYFKCLKVNIIKTQVSVCN